MVKFFKHKFTYEHPWSDVTRAHWLKYPNPFAQHVTTSDVVDQQIVRRESAGPSSSGAGQSGGGNGLVLRTCRLFLKHGNLPKWGRSFLKSSQSFVLEESEVDPVQRTMVTRTRNLNHRSIMSVEETQTYRPHPDNPQWTQVVTEARIVSNFGWGLTSRIEAFGMKKFDDNSSRSRKGMTWVLQTLRDKQREYRESFLGSYHRPKTA